ncbi:hypothetical protein [Acanthopleuribacter pedis]|uniref:Uncharacterized protein n=1 Tax=Acanthopleuribacter pedis TaxID=442870 RepID=A0A8J7U712_9BACT|nr:hypothetical protein [Acanthopleuribacter pedis]MBO1323327.1 hypothetical protein [Acanthopleuribacter pedis]
MSEKSSPSDVAKQFMRDYSRVRKQAVAMLEERDQLLAKFGMDREEIDRVVAEANFSPEVVAQVRRDVEQQLAQAEAKTRVTQDPNRRVSRHFRKMA